MKTARTFSPTLFSYVGCCACKVSPATIECQECSNTPEACYYCYSCDAKSHAHSYKTNHRRQVLNYKNLDRKFVTTMIPPIGPKPYMSKLLEQTADDNDFKSLES